VRGRDKGLRIIEKVLDAAGAAGDGLTTAAAPSPAQILVPCGRHGRRSGTVQASAQLRL
jgi:hypothetical protein